MSKRQIPHRIMDAVRSLPEGQVAKQAFPEGVLRLPSWCVWTVSVAAVFVSDQHVPAGMFQPNEAMSGCYACPSGQFQDETEAVGCQKCPCKPGMFTTSTSQGMKSSASCGCRTCDPGKYSNTLTGAAVSCKDCPTNKYSDRGSGKRIACLP